MTTVPPGRGRDRRRRLTIDERRQLFLRAGGRCQRCGEVLGDDWHESHLVAWINSGATLLDAMEAWCKKCNLSQGSRDAVSPPDIDLRTWQDKALPIILERLYECGYATLHAAPGAGKTLFAGLVFLGLNEMNPGLRMAIAVPNSNLRTQWKTALAKDLLIHIDDEPRDGWMEHRDTVGLAVTYPMLRNCRANHRSELENRPTFYVFDEVHHLGKNQAWGKAVEEIIGDVEANDIHAAGVLNMTGTLFRSGGRHRISTVRYNHVADNKIEAVADFSVRTKDLIPASLRPPQVWRYGINGQILNLETEEVTSGDIADLDEDLQRVILGGFWKTPAALKGFVTEAIRLLNLQQAAIEYAQPLKLLYVASTTKAAQLAADTLNTVVNDEFARLVISDEPGAFRTLRRAAREDRSLAIVAIKMVTEGFDCPDIATIAYASNITADLYIAQTMARAMRITNIEKKIQTILPAQILIPDHDGLKAAFARALAGQMHLLDADSPILDPTRDRGPRDGDLIEPRHQIIDLSELVLRGATVLGEEDGDVERRELDEWVQQMRIMGIPETYAPAVAVASRKVRRFPRVYSVDEAGSAATTAQADPRTINKARRAHIAKMSNWMAHHAGHDDRYSNVATFQALGNEAAGIEAGGRDQAAHTQLAGLSAWMAARIYEHCETYGCVVPNAVVEGGQS